MSEGPPQINGFWVACGELNPLGPPGDPPDGDDTGITVPPTLPPTPGPPDPPVPIINCCFNKGELNAQCLPMSTADCLAGGGEKVEECVECDPPRGACCTWKWNPATMESDGTCVDNITKSQCPHDFYEGGTCAELTPEQCGHQDGPPPPPDPTAGGAATGPGTTVGPSTSRSRSASPTTGAVGGYLCCEDGLLTSVINQNMCDGTIVQNEEECEVEGACCEEKGYGSGGGPFDGLTGRGRRSKWKCTHVTGVSKCAGTYYPETTCDEGPCPDDDSGPVGGPPGDPTTPGGAGGPQTQTVAAYCSPFETQVVEEKKDGKSVLIQSTTHVCTPMDDFFDSNVHDLCDRVEGCSNTTVNLPSLEITTPSFGEKFFSSQTPDPFFIDFVPEDVGTNEGLPLRWDTIPNEDITQVIGSYPPNHPQTKMKAGYMIDIPTPVLRNSKKFKTNVTTAGFSVITVRQQPSPGGTLFLLGQESGALAVTVVIGQAHVIYLAAGDSFAPTNVSPRGRILYGSGKILYNQDGAFNLSRFNGAIRTANGNVIFSNPSYRYTGEGKQTNKVRNTQHLESIRVYDPTFMSSRSIDTTPPLVRRRREEFHNRGRRFFSWNNPSLSEEREYYQFNDPAYFDKSRALFDKRFTLGSLPLPVFVEMNRDYIEYPNLESNSLRVFSRNVHRGIAATLHIINNNLNNYRPEYADDVNLPKIEKSLRGDLQNIITTLPNSFGDLINKNYILQGIYNLILNGEIDRFNPGYYKEYIAKHGTSEYYWQRRGYSKVRGGGASPPISTYGLTAEEVIAQRDTSFLPLSVPDFPQSPLMEDAAAYAVANRKSVDFRQYGPSDNIAISNENSEKMKRWWLLPQDINLNFAVEFANDNRGFINIINDKSFQFMSPQGTLIKAPIDRDYQTIFRTLDGSKAFTLEYDYTDLQYAYTLDPPDEARVLNNLGEEGIVQMVAETDNSKIEFNYNVCAALDPVYYLKIDPDTLIDRPNLFSQPDIVKTTEISYNVCSYDKIKDFAQEYQWPSLTLYVYVQDPILNIMHQEGKVKFRFNDVSFDFLGNSDIKFTRRIPPYIFLVPTDKTEFCPFYGESTLNTLNSDEDKLVRTLTFNSHFDTSLMVKSLNTLPMFSKFYPQLFPAPAEAAGLNPANYGRNDFEYVLKSDYFVENKYYQDGSQPSERRKSPVRVAYEIINVLKDYYILDQGLSEYDLLSRLEAQPFYALRNHSLIFSNIMKEMFDGSKEYMGTAFTGVRIYQNTIALNNVVAKSDYFNKSRIVEKKIDAVQPTLDKEKYLREILANPSQPGTSTGTTPGGGVQAPDTSKPGRDQWR